MFEHPDDAGFHYSSDTEWDRAEAYQLGELYPERAWVNTDRDVWHKNPFYKGPPVPHPESYDGEDTDEVIASAHIERDMLDDMPF